MGLLLSIRYCPAWQGSPTRLYPFSWISALKLISGVFAQYFNTYGRLTRRCGSRSAAVVRHGSGKHCYFYFKHNQLSKRHPVLPDRFIHLCPIFLLSIVACYLPFKSMRTKLAFCISACLFSLRCAQKSRRNSCRFSRDAPLRSRASEWKFYHYALLIYSCRGHPPFVLYPQQLNSVFIFVSVEKDDTR